MKLTYIYHSCFSIETEKFSILIDYYKDTDTRTKGYVHDLLLQKKTPLYVLSSHFHPDHFNPEILEWKRQKENIHYILSDDILINKRAEEKDALYIKKGEKYSDNNLTIHAFGSTDIGISFCIEAEEKKIFHAGDLNNWHWKDEAKREESLRFEQNYLMELEDIALYTDSFDVAMFPIDIRLGTDYTLGAEQFIDRIRTKLFVPMHFGEGYDTFAPIRYYAERRGVQFFNLSKKEESLFF